MSETQKKAYLVAAAMAILHNGKRYEQGDKIELTDDEAEKISLYIALDEDEAAHQQAEAKAEAEKKAQEAAKKRSQANKDKDEQ